MPEIIENFTKLYFGEVAVTAAAVALPVIKGSFVVIRARDNNVGNLYIGNAGVTIPDGVLDATSGWPISPGSETLAIPLPNNLLSSLYVIGTVGQSFSYMVFS